MLHFKKPNITSETVDNEIIETVKEMLENIKLNGESAVFEYAKNLDGWNGETFVLSDEKRQQLISQVSDTDKADIQFIHKQVTRFAQLQKDSITEFTANTEDGVTLGQKIIPVNCAGCYVPGGRYAHIASAIMSVGTAKVAGVKNIIAASPPHNGSIHPAIVYAMDLCGADVILEMGGVHSIASMAYGLFGNNPADILVGPGNAYVAEAKRLLFGKCGIDVFAGPTESAIIADETADPMTIAIDLASQAEHGTNSPVWLFTTSQKIAEQVSDIMPKLASDMPSGEVVMGAWENHGEIIVCENDAEMIKVSDEYAPEHLQILTKNNDWWLENLTNYGSLFIGEGSTVTHGDKCSGTNHILPTKGAGKYSGGLNVGKFMKVLTWQELSPDANRKFSAIASRISRSEGMDGHARACDWRLHKFFPDEEWDFEVTKQQRYDSEEND